MRQHGTHVCYVFGPEPGGDTSKGCRCDLCKKAQRECPIEPDHAFTLEEIRRIRNGAA